jgi:hypothetical protein
MSSTHCLLIMLHAMLTAPGGPLVSEEVKTRALTERAKQLKPEAYDQYKQNTVLVEYLRSLRDHTALWVRGLGVPPMQVHDVLGGHVESVSGQPDGQAQVTGAAWALAVAAGA